MTWKTGDNISKKFGFHAWIVARIVARMKLVMPASKTSSKELPQEFCCGSSATFAGHVSFVRAGSFRERSRRNSNAENGGGLVNSRSWYGSDQGALCPCVTTLATEDRDEEGHLIELIQAVFYLPSMAEPGTSISSVRTTGDLAIRIEPR